MSLYDIPPVALSVIEGNNGEYNYFKSLQLGNIGFEIEKIPKYGGDISEDIRLTEDILQRTGGLIVGRALGGFYPEQDAALFDRINVANGLNKPIFVPHSDWSKYLRHDIGAEKVSPTGKQAVETISGLDILQVVDQAELVVSSGGGRAPYGGLYERLMQ